jgi:hypothetical protein
MAGELKTQGTHLFISDATIDTSDPDLIKFACPTSITGLGGPADQINITCLDETVDNQFAKGLGNPGTVNVPFVFKPQEFSHQRLFAWKDGGETKHFAICASDGTEDATIDSEGNITGPVTRSTWLFDGYVSDIGIEFSGNDVVRGTLTIQRSGRVTFIAATA